MLIQCDASQLEWRILLLLSGDPVGISEMQEGKDLHSLNQAAFHLPSRLIAKVFLFRTIYRGSGYAFSKDNDFKHVSEDPDFWDAKNAAFYNKYQGINECHLKWRMQVANGKTIQGPSGREWQIALKDDGMPPMPTLTNYPVQGTGADLLAIARVSLRNRLKTGKLRSLLINTVHDSIVVDGPDEEVETVVEMMHQSFDALPKNMEKFWKVESPIPFPCEIKIGKSLGDLEKYESN